MARKKTGIKSWIKHWIAHPTIGWTATGGLKLISLFPVTWTSAFFGKSARVLAPILAKRAQSRALENLRLAFPDKDTDWYQETLKDMWENLGRVAGEFPHLKTIVDQGRITLIGTEHIANTYDHNLPKIFYSGHIGNWELCPAMALEAEIPVTSVYQKPPNRFMERLFNKYRKKLGYDLVAKGPAAISAAAKVIRQKKALAFLVDQRWSKGPLVPFFGHPVKTLPTPAEFAIRYKCQVFPVVIRRTKGVNFELICMPPMDISDATNFDQAKEDLLIAMNLQIENWIKETPAQWLWPHRRWRH